MSKREEKLLVAVKMVGFYPPYKLLLFDYTTGWSLTGTHSQAESWEQAKAILFRGHCYT